MEKKQSFIDEGISSKSLDKCVQPALNWDLSEFTVQSILLKNKLSLIDELIDKLYHLLTSVFPFVSTIAHF